MRIPNFALVKVLFRLKWDSDELIYSGKWYTLSNKLDKWWFEWAKEMGRLGIRRPAEIGCKLNVILDKWTIKKYQ